jgi:hypothetical protein
VAHVLQKYCRNAYRSVSSMKELLRWSMWEMAVSTFMKVVVSWWYPTCPVMCTTRRSIRMSTELAGLADLGELERTFVKTSGFCQATRMDCPERSWFIPRAVFLQCRKRFLMNSPS